MMVSICMPCYNRAKYLAGSIESCLKQTHDDVELVLVDDGSTDRTSKILKKYKKKYPNVKLLTNGRNAGIPRSFNRAICESVGEFIVINGSDDYYTPNSVECRLNMFLKYPELDVVCGAIKSFCGNKNYKWCQRNHDKLKAHSNRIPGHGVMLRRRVFEKYGLFYRKMRVNSDGEYWWRIGLTGERKTDLIWKRIDDPCAYVRLHDGSTACRLKKASRIKNKNIYIWRLLNISANGINKRNTEFL